MAFKKNYLQKFAVLTSTDLLAATGAYYVYQTADAASVVRAANYFDAVLNTLKVGDLIAADCNGILRHFKVATNDGVHVTTLDMSASGTKVFISGQATTVAASDTIATGLSTLTAAGATLNDPPSLATLFVSIDIGDQAGAPVAGSFLLKSWKPTAVNDVTPIAATAFAKKVNWWAWGVL